MLPARVSMKDGRAATLRRIEPRDAAPNHLCNRAVVLAGQGVVRGPQEMDKPMEQIARETREWISGPMSKRGVLIVADLGDAEASDIAGAGCVRRHPNLLIRHCGTIGLGVRPEAQGLGLGRALMLALVEWAKAERSPRITRLELNVLADNARAIALYESLGFEHEGRRRGAVRHADGRTVDDLMMGLLLE